MIHERIAAAGALSAIFPALIASILGYQALTILPLTTGALIETRALDIQSAGLMGSAELLGMAIGAALCALGVWRSHPQRLALCGTIWLVIWQIFSGLESEPDILLAARAATGLGAGVFVGLLARLIGQAAEPERLTGFVIILVAIYGGALLLISPTIIELFGISGLYIMLASITALLGMVLLFLFPISWHGDDQQAAQDMSGRRWSVADFPLLFFAVGFSAASSSLWAFTERLGLRHGFDLQEIGMVLAFGAITGVLGAGAATALARLAPHSLTIVKICAATIAVAGYVMASTNLLIVFLMSFLIFRFVQNFNDPFIVGSIARHDPQGRLLSLNASGGLIGVASGPALGGWLVAASPDFFWLAVFYLALTGLSFVALLVFLGRLTRR